MSSENKLALTLYSTLGCHLCELAEDIIYQSDHCQSIHLEIVDIADDENLLKHYGLKIPLVKNLDSDNEIGWPFGLNEFDTWLLSELPRH